MIYFTAHTFKYVCHCRRAMFRVLGMYNFAGNAKMTTSCVLKIAEGRNFIVPTYNRSGSKK